MSVSRKPSEAYELVDLIGASMSPTLLVGDTLVVERNTTISRGDIVALHGVVHRVVWLDPFGGAWHMGDCTSAKVQRAAVESVRGRVVAVQRGPIWVALMPSPRTRSVEIFRLTRAITKKTVRWVLGRIRSFK